MFHPRNAGKPQFSVSDAEDHFAPLYSRDDRTTKFGPPPGCPRPPKPKFEFNTSELEEGKLFEAVKKKRNKNAPGINGIPFLVYKMCPRLLIILLSIMNRIWSEKVIPRCWQCGLIVLIAKSDDLSSPGEFRPIALLNAEGRLFSTLLGWRLSEYMSENGYIDTTIQKGFMERIAGCIEHSETVHQAMLDAHLNKRNFCTSWIDLTNAFGSVH